MAKLPAKKSRSLGRAGWSGFMKIALMSFPVKLYNAHASSKKTVSLNQLHEKCNHRLRQQMVCPSCGDESLEKLKGMLTKADLTDVEVVGGGVKFTFGEDEITVGSSAVDKSEIVKGYEYDKDKYVVVSEKVLESVKVETTKTVDVVKFIDMEDLDVLFLDKCYFVVPDGPVAHDPYTLLRDAMNNAGRCAIGRVVMSGHEVTVAVVPMFEGIVMFTLHPVSIVKEATPFFDGLESTYDTKMLPVMENLIAQKEGVPELEEYEDRHEVQLIEHITALVEGREVEVPEIEEEPESAGDLMAALLASTQGDD